MKKLLFITPHLSTGGLPQVLLMKIEMLLPYFDIYVIEWNNYSFDYIIQKDKIKSLLGNKLTNNRNIDDIKPDIIHLEEFGETFMPQDILEYIHTNYKVTESTHTINYTEKKFKPYKYLLISDYNKTQYPDDSYVIKYPIFDSIRYDKCKEMGLNPLKKHIINVGLFTPGKNQKEFFEIAREYPQHEFHCIGNLAPNFKDYWESLLKNKPTNLTVHGEKEPNDFYQIADYHIFTSTYENRPLAVLETIARKIPTFMHVFDHLRELDAYVEYIDNEVILLSRSDLKRFRDELLSFYEFEPSYNITFNNGAQVEVIDTEDKSYTIKFYDNDKLIHQSTITGGMWTKTSIQYFINYRIEIYQSDKLIHTYNLDLKDKPTYITFDSKSLGDTLAWFPYVEEFRQKHMCDLYVSTFMNDLFIEQYPNIKFVQPGANINSTAKYNIGWYYLNNEIDFSRNPLNMRMQPMQKTATDILGLDYNELKPLLKIPETTKQKKVGIAIHSTAQAKYWNNPNGWQEVVNYLIEEGYDVVLYSKEDDGYMGNKQPLNITKFKGGTIQDVINDMSECEFFIGIGSGLSWLAWSINLPIVLISGFSDDYTETQSNTYRVINKSVCNGCFNKYKLDSHNWNWCPINKDFECTKSITSDMVIEQIQNIKKVNKKV